MLLAESLLEALKARGAGEIFGIPGDFALPFFEVIERSRILPYYTFSHEPAVGFAADAAARYRSGLGVAAVTYGAGAFNLVNPIACAYSEKSPVVVISGAPGAGESSRGLLLHHQAKTLASQLEVYREITCDQAVLDNAATAPEEIDRVLTAAIEQSRPVYIELPRDLVTAPTPSVPPPRPRRVDPDAAAACAEEILERLRAARDPVILAGVEVRRFGLEAKLASLAHRLGVPVATSFMGRGLFAGHDCPFVGTYLGLAGDPEVSALVEGADALLLMGVILSDTNFGVSARQVDLRHAIDVSDGQVRIAHHLYPDLPIGALCDALLERASTSTQPTRVGVASPTALDGLMHDDAPIAPDDIARAVNDLFRRHAPMPMAADMGDCLFTAMDMENTALVAPGYYATMGFGVPAGLGLQAASGRRPLILVGDGAFQMTGWELGNCRRYGWDPIVLVFNNSGWEMLAAFQPHMPYNRLDDWPFAELARHLGGDGVRVTTRRELGAALERAVATRGRFQLIDIVLPRGTVSRRLSRFVKAVAR
jgi:indolepyruvate decarboxylase